MNVPSDVAAVKTDWMTPTGVLSRVTCRFVYENTVYRVHLTPEQAETLGLQLMFKSAEVEPALVGMEDNQP